MSDVTIDAVGYRYERGGGDVLADVSLEVSSGELLCVLGTSGSGKSTLLHLLTGLFEPSKGRILVDDKPMSGVPSHKRQIILLSQKALLFPFTSVEGNVAFSPRLRGQSKRERARRVAELLDLVGLSGFESRMPNELSGGEAQRVALARALAADPTVLLMDEPFSNLDTPIRSELQGVFRELHERQKLTTMFVTHQLDEAMALGDRVACLVDGRIEMVDTPVDVYQRPSTTGAAHLVGVEHWLEGEWHGLRFSGPWGTVEVDEEPTDSGCVVAARPEHVNVTASTAKGLDGIQGVIADLRYRGAHFDVTVELLDGSCLRTQTAVNESHAVGDSVSVSASPGAWFPLRKSDTEGT